MKRPTHFLALLPVFLALLAAEEGWRDKRVAEWTADEVHQVLTDSPWAKTVQPTVLQRVDNGQRRGGGGMGRGGGIGIGGIGIGIPGMGGMGRRGGGGGGYPGGGYPDDSSGPGPRGDQTAPPELKLRWESAMPVRAAEMKAHETNAPDVDEDHYAVAVYGIPSRMANSAAADQLKKEAVLKREGQKDIKPSSVDVLQRDNGVVIVYLFPRTREITQKDRHVTLNAQIGRLKFEQSFYVEDMVYQGKLEL